MALTLSHTGDIIAMYMEENDVTIIDLQNKSNVNMRTIYRVLKGEVKLNSKLAIALEELVPGLSAEYLLSYDSKYQLQKTKFANKNNVKDLTPIIDKFKLKKLYPSVKDEMELFNLGKEIFGIENLQNNNLLLNPKIKYLNFSIAKNSKYDATVAWINTAMSEYISNNEILEFKKDSFEKCLKMIKQLSNTNTFELTEYNISNICKKSGINYYNRNSIPNSRVRGICIKDNDNHIYIFTSNLFKCIENRWLHFVHECIHIKNGDLISMSENETEENENKVYEDSMKFFVGENLERISRAKKIDDLQRISNETKTPIGIVVEIYREITKDYSNYYNYLHRYK